MRINALDTNLWEDDVAGIAGALPDGILLPKARSGEDVHTLSIALDHAEEKAGAKVGSTRIIALVTETPISLLQLHTYVGSSTRLDGVTWGAEDLSAVLGARTNREDDGRAWTSPYMLARNLCLFTAAAADAQPIDTVFVNFRDEEGLRQECLAAVRDGFTGKMAIHPNQVAVMNEVFTPSAEEIAHVAGADPAVRRQPGCRRADASRPDGRQGARRPRRAHPGACQDGEADGSAQYMDLSRRSRACKRDAWPSRDGKQREIARCGRSAPATERARVRTAPPSLPERTIHCPLEAWPTISPT